MFTIPKTVRFNFTTLVCLVLTTTLWLACNSYDLKKLIIDALELEDMSPDDIETEAILLCRPPK